MLASGENVLLNSDNKVLIQKYVEQSVEMHTKLFKQADLCNSLKNLRVEFSQYEQEIAQSDSAGEPKKQVKKVLAPEVYKEFMIRKKTYQESQHTLMEPLNRVKHELGALEERWFALMKEYQNSLNKSEHTIQTRWPGKTQHNNEVRLVMGQLEEVRVKKLYAGECHMILTIPASECDINVLVSSLRWSSLRTSAREDICSAMHQPLWRVSVT